MSGTPSPASSLTDPAFRNLTDDLRLAHLLADDADSITTNRFKALDLHVVAKPDLTPSPMPTPRSRRPSVARSAAPGRGTPCTARRWRTPVGVRGAG